MKNEEKENIQKKNENWKKYIQERNRTIPNKKEFPVIGNSFSYTM